MLFCSDVVVIAKLAVSKSQRCFCFCEHCIFMTKQFDKLILSQMFGMSTFKQKMLKLFLFDCSDVDIFKIITDVR